MVSDETVLSTTAIAEIEIKNEYKISPIMFVNLKFTFCRLDETPHC